MATPSKTTSKRVTPKKDKPDTQEITRVVIKSGNSLSFEALDNITSASGWSQADLIREDGTLTGKGYAGSIWLSTRSVRPDVSPEDIYTTADHTTLGLEFVAEEVTENPTDAAS
ncbi:hypothetical protein [Kocuria rosea]|uniref:hypothetical protein n=1 Tax=Kocuria rosea TaxID=1275 RepID=UPI00254212F1|nr:hypothetical protein [Kocuria rosea]WIG18390.1 hypothetical protein QOY29_05530 [Kocuria rosea]